jgi:Coenzyme PQQ synthesis protein D (PqqD)
MDRHIEIEDDVRFTADADGAVLLDVGRGTYFSLNRSGAAIWRDLRDGRTPDDIAAALAQRHGRPADEVEHDVRAFVDQLRARRLVRVG